MKALISKLGAKLLNDQVAHEQLTNAFRYRHREMYKEGGVEIKDSQGKSYVLYSRYIVSPQ